MLPYPGTIGEQPAWAVEAISGLEHEHQEIQAEAFKPKRGAAPGAVVNEIQDATQPPPKPRVATKRPPPRQRPKA